MFWNLDHDISAMASPDALEAKNTGDEENDWRRQAWHYLPVEAAVALCAFKVSPVDVADTKFWNLDHDDISGDGFIWCFGGKIYRWWREQLTPPSTTHGT
jgi:hypothetical protein